MSANIVFDEGPRPSMIVPGRASVSIVHEGNRPSFHSPLGEVVQRCDWPRNLWGDAVLVFDIMHPELSLGPPLSPDDQTLRFDSRFESGNLSKAYKFSDESYHLIIEHDHDEKGLCQWFYFSIKNARKDVAYQFYLSCFHKKDNVLGSGGKVFYYSEKRAKADNVNWTRGGSDYGYAVTRRTGSKPKLDRATSQFKMQFPYDDDVCYICYALPYTYTDLLRAIDKWTTMAPLGVVTCETLCKTACGRDVPVMTITSPTSPIPLAGKTCIFLTGRIHPGESNSSYVLHGLIDFLLSDHPCAKVILDRAVVKIVPMMGIDGVVEGSYRIFSAAAGDLNRMWGNPSLEEHPVVYHTKKLIENTARERPIAVYMDFHGHSRLHGTFAFGCPNDMEDVARFKDHEKTLPRLFSFVSDKFSWEHCIFSFPKERDEAGRIRVRRDMGIVQSFTIETSFGACKSGKYAGMLYDETLWKDVGAELAEGVYHYLIPTISPLVSYVDKELTFFAPTKMDVRKGSITGAVEKRKSTGSLPKMERRRHEKDTEPDRNDFDDLPVSANGHRPLVRVCPPRYVFHCNADDITECSACPNRPVWLPLNFALRKQST